MNDNAFKMYLPGFAKSGDELFVVFIFAVCGQYAKGCLSIFGVMIVFEGFAGFVEASSEGVVEHTEVQNFRKGLGHWVDGWG